jgi:hypothetical protein
MKWSFLIGSFSSILMPSQKGKRAKGVQMTEQQPKTTQIIDIVEMQPTQNGSQTPDTAQIEDILQLD